MNRKMTAKPSGSTGFPGRYGSWAMVAGASEGLGAAFARALAQRGMNLVLLARRKNLLDTLAQECTRYFAVKVQCIEVDLAAADAAEKLRIPIDSLEVGVIVYNAAFAPIGSFATIPLSELQRVVDVNVRCPLALVRTAIPAMLSRGKGAVVLMSSLAGNQGTPRIATYAASKAFNTILGEGLWHELKSSGVDVITCCAGAIRTPGYQDTAAVEAPGTMNAQDVAEKTLRALGRGPRAIPGFVNRVANFALGRVFSRRLAISLMAGSTKNLIATEEPGSAHD